MNLYDLQNTNVNVEEKITNLKQKLKILKGNFQMDVYKILKEILTLRQSQITNYKVRTLAKEKDIDLTEHQIVYYFGFDYLSSTSKSLIECGELNATTFLFLLRRNVEFRKHDIQDLIVRRLLDKKITTAQIGTLTLDNLLHISKTPEAKKKMEKSIQFLARTRELSRQFDLLEDYIIDSEVQTKIKNCLITLVKKINRRMKNFAAQDICETQGVDMVNASYED